MAVRKRRAGAPSFKADAGADYGPALKLRADGRLVAWPGAARVEVGTRDDPAFADRRQVVRGARRCNMLAELAVRGTITKRMADAANQFLDDCSIASGGSAGDSVAGMPAVSGPRRGLPERQVEALTRVLAARLLLGLNGGTVFWHVVFGNGRLDDFDRYARLRNGTAAGMLRNALEALDAHYHETGSQRRA